jgi:hypothetical protein
VDERTWHYFGELLDRVQTEQEARVKGLQDENARLRDDLARERDENRRLWAAMAKAYRAFGVMRAGGGDWEDEAKLDWVAADKLLDGLVPLTPA